MIIRNCPVCNKDLDTCPPVAKKGQRRFCSNECFAKWIKINWRGENHPCWKGGPKASRERERIKRKAYYLQHRESMLAHQRQRGLEGKHKGRDAPHRFGITKSDYLALIPRLQKEQNNTCAICGYSLAGKRWGLDHNHATKQLRGILCHSCNVALGLLKENKQTLRNMLNYLENYENIGGRNVV